MKLDNTFQNIFLNTVHCSHQFKIVKCSNYLGLSL